ncbi:hypothetical protein BDB00DRAFT_789062 [Zychaea mexicana]|uniref:uncharacterized protein n=1 Tax=Zychaea mexicana TaxID=64656 RepID=UPI0022FEAFD2|nr:uncharacterized protein BDB00DRAFT_789062 [Zychaea mexicana]KAI9492109.1 hypothetical protein BDB00DRAFT_789062 [Zychaea mexicana]
MMAEMELMKSEFSRRYNSMIQDYEEMGAVVRHLNKELRKKDEELSILRIRYQDAMAENDLLYEAFNNELDQMYDLYEQRATRPSVNQRLEHEDDGIGGPRRPSHPSPEAQIRKKLELTIKERNQWHQTACKLARELQTLSQGHGNTTTFMPSSSTAGVRPANSRSTPTPPFRHSMQ